MRDAILDYETARATIRARCARTVEAARTRYMASGEEITAAVLAAKAAGGDSYAQAAAIGATTAARRSWAATDAAKRRERAALASADARYRRAKESAVRPYAR